MKPHKRWGLAVWLVFYTFLMMLAAMALAAGMMGLISRLGVPVLGREAVVEGFALGALAWLMILSVGIGTALASFFSRRALKPIRRLVEAMRSVARGDFTVRAESRGSIHELEDLYSSFNQMTRELAGTQTLRTDFINHFSHEFKTPIVSIRGFAKLLKDGGLTDAERQEYLEIIITESERLSTLATNVLNLSKYEAMEIVAEKENFRIDEQLRRAIAVAEPLWAARGIIMDVALEEALFHGNADLIQHIWQNLLDNAIKFSRNGGRINIVLTIDSADGTTHTAGKAADAGIRVVFTDEGIGMDSDTLSHIFDKFYQGDASHTTAGNGLGLTMVKRIAELHGGNITVESEPGQGSIFAVTLPRL